MPAFPVSQKNICRFGSPSSRWLLLVLGVILLFGCAAQSGVYHTVEPGQTLYRIGRAYQVDESHLARINGIDDPTNLRVGQRLYIPDATHAVVVPKHPAAITKPGPSVLSSEKTPPAVVAATPTAPKPQPQKPRVNTPPAPRPPNPSSTVEKPSAPQAPDKGRFQWPLKGEVIRTFGSAGGTLNKGIEISSPVGSAVRSAGAGRVIYSSDGVAGYGNLIIIRHDDGFFSVYGFNQKNLVSVGTFVSRGQRIALSGTSPGGGSPRLHFEIRNGKDAVNPIFYLP